MRKQKKYHLIYKTTNLLNGKYYIGMHSTNNLDDGYMGSGRRLRYSINKHGEDNHKVEILEFVETREELIARETEIVNLNEIAKVDCMNLKAGGQGGFISVEQQRHRSECAGKANAERLKTDDEYRERFLKRMSKQMKEQHKLGKMKSGKDVFDWTDKKHCDETLHKIRESKKGQGKGETNSQFGSCWITNGIENKKIMRGNKIPYGWRLGRVIN
jgi:hypothetical protein